MDHITLLANQRNNCRRKFGETTVNLPGRTDMKYPNMDGLEAGRLTYYWKSESDRLRGKITFGPFTTGIPDSAHKAAWLRAKDNFDREAPKLVAMTAINKPLPGGHAVMMWQMLDALVQPMSGLGTTASRFDLGFEAVIEASEEFAARADAALKSSWLMPTLIIGGGLVAFTLINNAMPRGR